MSVLVLGATSPIARRLAQRYAEAGRAVFVTARDAEEAQGIAADLRIRYQVDAGSAAFDATDFDAHPALVEQAEERVGTLTVAVVAFGEMGEQSQSESEFARARSVIDTNFTGAASICEAIAARMVVNGGGSIVGLASVAGDRGRQSNYFYGAAKGAFALYLQGLRNRMHHQGVHVMTVKLGFVDTRMTFGMRTGIPIVSPDQVSRALFDAQQRGVDTLYYPRFWRGIMGVVGAIPERIFKRMRM